jgi:riboflavin kinase/FMN adenylyltransferase
MNTSLTKPPGLYRYPDDALGDAFRGVVAVGNFDGVHRGHRHVLGLGRERAETGRMPVLAVTFEPHPAAFFSPDSPPFRLTSPEDKTRLLRERGADAVDVVRFDAELAGMAAEEFVEKFLIGRYAARHVVTGYDFRFGKGREGNRALLERYAAQGAFSVTSAEPFACGDLGVASSGRIRALLRDGDVETAARLLGRPMRISGVVARGDGNAGRLLGVPTANIAMGEYVRPRYGVYAAEAEIAGIAGRFGAAVNIGVRPTLDGAKEWLEAHLLGEFSREALYGKEMAVDLLGFLREERRFSGAESLRSQIGRDVEGAAAFLGARQTQTDGARA